MVGLMVRGGVALLLAGFAGALPAAEQGRTPPIGVLVPGEKRAADLEAAAAQVLVGANTERRKAGAGDLAVNRALAEAAQAFAVFMATTDRYGHESDGRQLRDRVEQAGYVPCIAAENLAYQFLSTGFSTAELAQMLVEGWMDSRGHRANLLNPDVTETGVGLARSQSTGRYYAVQMFGRPRALEVHFEIHNGSGSVVTYRLGGQEQSLPPATTVTHSQCTPGRVVFDWPGSQPPSTVAADDDARLEIVRTARGGFEVRNVPP